MIRIVGTRIELWTLPGQVGLGLPLDSQTMTVDQARRLATQLLRAANEAEAAAEPVPSIGEQAEAKARRRARAGGFR